MRPTGRDGRAPLLIAIGERSVGEELHFTSVRSRGGILHMV